MTTAAEEVVFAFLFYLGEHHRRFIHPLCVACGEAPAKASPLTGLSPSSCRQLETELLKNGGFPVTSHRVDDHHGAVQGDRARIMHAVNDKLGIEPDAAPD